MKKIKDLNVVSMVIRDTPKVQPVYSRPFVPNASDGAIIGEIAELVSNTHDHVLPSQMATLSGHVMTLSDPVEESPVPNGYDTHRCSFVLRAVTTYEDNTRELTTVMGFTASDRVMNEHGHLNTSLVYYVSKVSSVRMPAMRSSRNLSRRISADILLPDHFRSASGVEDADDMFDGPPSVLDWTDLDDIWSTQTTSGVFSDITLTEETDEWADVPSTFINTTRRLGDSPLSASSAEGSIPGFMSKLINTYTDSVSEVADDEAVMGSHGPDLYGTCYSKSNNNIVYNNPLLLAISELDRNADAWFTIRDIEEIDTTFNQDRVHYFPRGRDDVEDWRNYAEEDYALGERQSICALVNMSLNSFSTRSGLSSCELTVTNRTNDSEVPHTVSLRAPTVLSGNRQEANTAAKSFSRMIREELCPLLDTQYEAYYLLRIGFDAIGETTIRLWLDVDTKPLMKVYPGHMSSASSGLLLPPQSDDRRLVRTMANLLDVIDVHSDDLSDDPTDPEGYSTYTY
jgi:hypothetical protein